MNNVNALNPTKKGLDAPANPFRQARERRNYTIQALAVKAKVSRYLVIRTEQGCFPEPPPRLLNYVTQAFVLDPDELTNDYHDFQKEMRWLNERLLGPLPDFPNTAPSWHPFVLWRQHTNNNNFNLTHIAKSLCLAQPVLYHFEHKPRQQASVPAQLLSALADARYSREEIQDFKLAYNDYREYLRTGGSQLEIPSPYNPNPEASMYNQENHQEPHAPVGE